jgi:SAM-dependent methyltransferase
VIQALPSLEVIAKARSELASRRLDFSDRELWRLSLPMRALRRLRLVRAPFLPDPIKAWDVLVTLNMLLDICDPSDPILDLGCKDSAVLPCLALNGFRSLFGVDLDRSILAQPTFGCIKWRVADFYHNEFRDSTFAAISAISTIEHGLDTGRLAREMSRLLRPGGLFVFSTDYHALKLDTSEIRHFGVEWKIFSREDIRDLLANFEQHGLEPLGSVSLDHDSAPIHWMGRDYTFVIGALRKRRGKGA